MANLMKTVGVGVSSIAVAVAAAHFSGPRESGERAHTTSESSAGAQDPGLVAAHAAAARDRVRTAEWASTMRWQFLNEGMETGSAGVRLVRPFRDPHLQPGSRSDTSRSGGFWFWDLETAYEIDEYQPDGLLDTTTSVSFTRVLENKWMQVSVVPDGAPSEYRVEALFDAAAILKVGEVVGPRTSPQPFTDWYGMNIPANGVATEMRVAVVSDDTAYRPFSASLVADANAPTTVVLANGLTFDAANELATRLNR